MSWWQRQVIIPVPAVILFSTISMLQEAVQLVTAINYAAPMVGYGSLLWITHTAYSDIYNVSICYAHML